MKKIYLLLFLVLNFIFIVGCVNDENETKEIIDIIKDQTNITIPQEVNLTENYQSNIFLHGRLPKYYIFQLDQVPKEFLLNNAFQEMKNEEFEQNIINKLEDENEKYDLKIPNDSLIKFDESYLYIYQEDDYCLIYYPNNYK